ncbi:hypothetical protein EJB05_23976, partial [Eragrostis curvula]
MKRSSACSLPEDLVEDILSCLPAKSLRRFQCVSRSFQTMIASRAFQDTHFQRNRGNRSLFIRPPRFLEPFYAWQPGGPVEKIMGIGHQLPQGSIFPISKSCRGLVLLSCLEYQTHTVWNPSTGEAFTLPDRIPLRAARCVFSFPRYPLVSYGLGYCSATQRHKVVRMYCLRGSVVPAATFCEVFVLNESACWRPAATKQLEHYCPPENWRQGAVFCNGNLHFLREDGGVTTFNVKDETFGLFKFPTELHGSTSNFELTELDGYLCVYTCTLQWERTFGYPFELWLLRDYGASGKWEKILGFDWGTLRGEQGMQATLKSYWIAPLDVCFDNWGQKKIVFGTGSCNVLIIDPSISVAEILLSPVDTTKGNNRFPTMGLFEESLTRVNDTSTKPIFSSPSTSQAWSDVLSRLPARTLGRLKQVCKGWSAMIQTESFVASHLCRANLNMSPQMMFIGGKPYGFEHMQYFIDTQHATPPLVDDCLRVVCSNPCHGLNTVSFCKYDFVCNPITGYSKVLPLDDSMDRKGSLNNAINEASSWHCNGEDFFAGRLGLGYEPKTSRHVLVRLAYKERNLTTRIYKLVCKMRYIDDMFWDEIDPPPRPIASMPPAYVKSKLYWMTDIDFIERSPCYEIIVLDIGTRKFGVFQGPLCNSERVLIIELHERVCVACFHQSTNIMEIWETKDNVLWSVKYHLELGRLSPEYLPELATPLAVDPKDGRVLLSTGRALGYYDPNTTELQMIFQVGKHVKGKKFVPILFKESLVNPRDPIFSMDPYKVSVSFMG